MGVDIEVTIDTNSKSPLQRIDQHFMNRCSQALKSVALHLTCQLSTFLWNTSQMQVCPVTNLISSDIPVEDRPGRLDIKKMSKSNKIRLLQNYCTRIVSTDAIKLLNLFGSFPSRGCNEHIGQGIVQCDLWCLGMALVPGTELIHLKDQKIKYGISAHVSGSI